MTAYVDRWMIYLITPDDYQITPHRCCSTNSAGLNCPLIDPSDFLPFDICDEDRLGKFSFFLLSLERTFVLDRVGMWFREELTVV